MDPDKIIKEFSFKAVRSSGAGGQHVNKVSSKVELHFDIVKSVALSEEEKSRLLDQLASRLTKLGVLIIQADSSRSQLRNKNLTIKRCIDLINQGLTIPKKRKQTRPSKRSIEDRLEKKKRTTQKKEFRKRPDLDS